MSGFSKITNIDYGYDTFLELFAYGITRFFYYLLFESLFQKTIGKMLMRIRVINYEDFGKPDFDKIFVRTLSRFIPLYQFSLINKDSHGWHDKISDTIVVKDKDYKVYLKSQTENTILNG